MTVIQWNKEQIENQQREALRRYNESAGIRRQNEEALKTKNPTEVDTEERVRARKKYLDPRDELALERLMGKSDLFPISYLEMGLIAGKSVCRITVRNKIGGVLGYGTGFLASPSLLITNNHILEDADAARFSLVEFNVETDLDLKSRPIKSFRLDPDRFFITDRNLDFSLVAIEKTSADGSNLAEFGFLPFIIKSGKVLVGEYVSIIQHPNGGAKTVVIRENELISLYENYIHYKTDTEPGSSGSPVFSDEWNVVALHHMGVPDSGDSSKYVANEGVRISSIGNYLIAPDFREQRNAEERILIDELLSGWSKPPATGPEPMRMEVGDLGKEWYERSTGYDPAFLGENFSVPLPSLRPDQVADVALANDGATVLNYTHFSLVMSGSRRLAFFTAVNIDGSQMKESKRTKDKWYYDPRIDKAHQCGPELYQNNDLDYGHLVRRLDPVWGDDADTANEDTFHFTNCSPQHKNLNQKTWLNLENYIYKNATKYGLKVNVFTGPVFRADDIVYHGEYKIPAEFWKVVVMVKDTGTLSATAYLQTQKNLIRDLEFAYGEYRTYQVPVAMIESLTGLDFARLRSFDPIARIESTVGRIIEQPEDIRV